MLTFGWGVVLVGFASLFEDTNNPVLELGLTVASFTCGSLLGVFLLGIISKRTEQIDAWFSFAITIVFMVLVVFGIWHSADGGCVFEFNPADADIAQRGLKSIAWSWYPAIGSMTTLLVGSFVAFLRTALESGNK